MNPIIVRNIAIGEGIPKICVPIAGVTKEEIIEETKMVAAVDADLAEWRIDWYEDVFDFVKVRGALSEIRNILGDMPILVTFRSEKEGGEKPIETGLYIALNKMVSETEKVDLIDVELFSGDDAVKEIIDCAHAHNVKVVISNHDFQTTPSKDEMIVRLQKMQDLDADILKIAVMPQTKEDVKVLLEATKEMSSKYATKPIVTMSMSELGSVSRIAGEIYGSAMTFGTAKKASAPGQMPVEELKLHLQRIHLTQNVD